MENINSEFGSSGYFGSRVSSKFSGHNNYINRRRKLCSKLPPIHGPVQKSEFKFSSSIKHSSCLTQEVSKRIIDFLSQNVIYSSIIIDPVISSFNLDQERSHMDTCDKLIITFGERGFC